MGIDRRIDDAFEQLAAGVLDTSRIEPHDDDGSGPDPSTGSGASRQWGDGVRLLAFRLWVFDGARDPAKVSKLLHDRLGVKVPPRQILLWSGAERWAVAAVDFHQIFQNQGRSAVEATFSQGTVKAARWLVDCLDDPDVPANTKMRAAMAVLDRGGFAPVLQSLTSVQFAPRVQSGAYVDVSDEELDAYIQSYAGDGGGIAPDPEHSIEELRIAAKSADSHGPISGSGRHPS